jgi:hypothetical protein
MNIYVETGIHDCGTTTYLQICLQGLHPAVAANAGPQLQGVKHCAQLAGRDVSVFFGARRRQAERGAFR